METCVSASKARPCVSAYSAAVSAFLLVTCAGLATAQTTVTLNDPRTNVVYATLRAGKYASTNQGNTLETKNTEDQNVLRRALLKFDTQNTIPKGSAVRSATMTVTIAPGAGAIKSRRIAAYQTTQSWDENQVTWNKRRTDPSQPWQTAGGDLGAKLGEQVADSAAGTTITFDVTPLVAQAVSGALGSSRYTRIALVDVDPPQGESRRIYYTPDDPDIANRPKLTVTYDGSASSAPQATTTQPSDSGGSTLKVLEYNVHHGGKGTDGKLDLNRIADWIVRINPDVVSLVEVESYDSYYSGDGVAAYKSLLQQKTGVTWYTLDIQDYGDWSSPGIRNAILSKLPLSGTYRHEFTVGRDRTVGGVLVNVNGRNINIMSTHFDPYDQSNRITQATQLVSYATGFAESRIILGDFNALPGATETATMTATYYDAWAEAVKKGIQESAPDNPNGYTRNGRIDYVFYSRTNPNLTLAKVEVVDTRDASGVMPSDHRPLVATFTVK
jgi:endonuclease/exonuclease/phosphatase family metal-dependent hydrolase